MIVLPTESGAPIRWQCSVCDDEGMISNWEDSPFDLRRQRLTLAGAVNDIVISDEVAAALRELRLLDADWQRLVFAIRARHPRRSPRCHRRRPGRADQVRGGRG